MELAVSGVFPCCSQVLLSRSRLLVGGEIGGLKSVVTTLAGFESPLKIDFESIIVNNDSASQRLIGLHSAYGFLSVEPVVPGKSGGG